MPTTPSSKYRPEIDGLRAFAVVAVIINHFNKDLLPSGYLGVDIFFVISGYVITSSLAGRESKNFLDFLSGFYERRIKRLVPALVVFVLITSVLISLFNPEPGGALGLGWRSLFGISNINLYRSSTDYFAQSTELNPFTHTWSLGVEEQFYLLFPFLIWFSGFGQQTAKGARNLFFWVGAMTIASLLGFIYLYQVNQPAAYFLMPPRFWEMAAGCLLFIGFQKRARIEQALEKVPPLLVVAAMVGVMYLPVVAAVPATIGIVVLSAVLIACLKRGTVAYKFFTLEKVVYIGLISYSLYLWHWTVLSISRWTIGIHWWSVPIQCSLMLIAAALSYKWIEIPIRKNQWELKKIQIITGGLSLVAVSGIGSLMFSKSLSSKSIYLGVDEKFLDPPKISKTAKITVENCFNNKANFSKVIEKCKENYGQSGISNTIWAVGDSHTLSLVEGLRKIAQDKKLELRVLTRSGTAFPQSNTYRQMRRYHMQKEDLRSSRDMIDMEEYLLLNAKKGDNVIIAMRFPYHFGEDSIMYEYKQEQFRYINSISNDIEGNKEAFFEHWADNVLRLSRKLSALGVKLIIVSPTPEWQAAVNRECKGQNTQWFNRLGQKECIESKALLLQKFKKLNARLNQLAANSSSISTLNSLDLLCQQDYCTFRHPNGQSLYSDDDHLSDYAITELIAPKIVTIIDSQSD
jgi:peptidoglycan/LPS O-acetylase OafA/YrhL